MHACAVEGLKQTDPNLYKVLENLQTDLDIDHMLDGIIIIT